VSISVRRAESRELEFVSQDGYLRPDLLEQEVEHGDVFLAEMEGNPAGYLRLEFLWSTQPYLALIRVIDPSLRPKLMNLNLGLGTVIWGLRSVALLRITRSPRQVVARLIAEDYGISRHAGYRRGHRYTGTSAR
jgi:hypothetical protein